MLSLGALARSANSVSSFDDDHRAATCPGFSSDRVGAYSGELYGERTAAGRDRAAVGPGLADRKRCRQCHQRSLNGGDPVEGAGCTAGERCQWLSGDRVQD
jgi:hypothetical protein